MGVTIFPFIRILRRASAVVIPTAAILVTGCVSAPGLPSPATGQEAALASIRLRAERAADDLADGGLGVAVVMDGELIMAEGFGQADAARELEVTSDTVFRIGSVTKLFTAIAVMQLVEAGLIDLDRPYTDYVADLTMRTRDGTPVAFTVRDLLSHHAGVPGDWFNDWTSGLPDEPGWETRYRQVVQEPIRTTMEPRTVFSYSNIGYSLLGVLIERVSGMDYSDYLQDAVLRPLGMDSASFYTDGRGAADPDAAARLARPYAARGFNGRELDQIRDVPAGSLQASIRDLGRFTAALSRGYPAILNPETLTLMGSPQNTDVDLDADLRIGLGFWLVDPINAGDIRFMSHGGAIPPYYAFASVAPDEGLGLMVVTNSDDGAALVYELGFEGMRSLIAAHRGAEAPRHDAWAQDEQPLSDETQSMLAGFYASPLGLLEIVPARRGRLRMRTPNGTLTLRHRGGDEFTAEVRRVGIRLARLSSLSLRSVEINDTTYLALGDNGIPVGMATPFSPAPVPETWLARVGSYEVVDAGVYPYFAAPRISFDEKTGILLLEDDSPVSGGLRLPLRVVSNELAVTEGLGRGMGEALEVIGNEADGRIRYSGVEFRRVD